MLLGLEGKALVQRSNTSPAHWPCIALKFSANCISIGCAILALHCISCIRRPESGIAAHVLHAPPPHTQRERAPRAMPPTAMAVHLHAAHGLPAWQRTRPPAHSSRPTRRCAGPAQPLVSELTCARAGRQVCCCTQKRPKNFFSWPPDLASTAKSQNALHHGSKRSLPSAATLAAAMSSATRSSLGSSPS